MGTLVVGAFVAGVIGLAARKVYKDRKSGKGCGGCEGCPGRADCGGEVFAPNGRER